MRTVRRRRQQSIAAAGGITRYPKTSTVPATFDEAETARPRLVR
jgi:hypothetical protein